MGTILESGKENILQGGRIRSQLSESGARV